MKTFIPFILAACLTIAFSCLTMEKAFSQADQRQKMDTSTVADGTSPYVTGITAGRARSLVSVALGLISLIIGWRAVSTSSGRKLTIAAFVLGLVAIVLSAMHLATISGGFGTGGGKAGAIVALVLGFIGMALGGVALLRSK